MRKTDVCEVMFDIMSQNHITLKEFTKEFFFKKVKNLKYKAKFLEGLDKAITPKEKVKIQSSESLHGDLFEDLEEEFTFKGISYE